MSDSKHDSIDGPPSPKRPKIADPPSPNSNLSEEDGDEEEEDNFDPDSFYMSSSPSKLAEPVQRFMQSALKRCIPKRKRRELGTEYPRPDKPAAKVPKLDPDIVGALADDIKKGEDGHLMKIQATVLASASPLANFWSHLTEQGFKGKEDEYVAVGEVIDVMKASLMLIGNASHYITQSRRKSIIESTNKSRPRLAKFLQVICRRDLGDMGEDFFGPEVRKMIVERANIINAFNKAQTNVDPPSKKQNQQGSRGHCLARGSVGSYGGGPS